MTKLRRPYTLFSAAAAAVILIFLTAPQFAAPVEAGSWRPARPDDGPMRYRLVPTTGEPGASRASYLLLAPGESARFPVTGSGELRLRTRPVFDAGNESPVFRLGVCVDDTTCRRFKRRSDVESEFTVQPVSPAAAMPVRTLLLGEEDVLELDIDTASGSVRVENRDPGTRSLLLRMLLRGDLVQPRPAGAADRGARHRSRGKLAWDVDVLQLGYDSNAFLAPADSNNNESRLFWPVRAGVDWRLRRSAGLAFDARYSFSGRIYSEKILNEYRHRLAAGQRWRPGDDSRLRDFTLELEEGLSTKQSTFFGRGDDVEFETTVGGTTLSLADRFDNLRFYVGPRLEWTPAEDVVVSGNLVWNRIDYLEDYGEYDDIYALDQDRLDLDLELEWRVAPDARLTGEAGRADKLYDEKFSRDATGQEVRGEAAHYTKTHATAGFEWGGRTGPRVGAEFKAYRNRDQYEGYWDYDGNAVQVTAGWRSKSGRRLDLELRRSATDYERSHVGNDAGEPLREKTVWNVRASAVYPVAPRWEAVFRAHYKDYDYNNRDFAYDRLLVQAGARFDF